MESLSKKNKNPLRVNKNLHGDVVSSNILSKNSTKTLNDEKISTTAGNLNATCYSQKILPNIVDKKLRMKINNNNPLETNKLSQEKLQHNDFNINKSLDILKEWRLKRKKELLKRGIDTEEPDYDFKFDINLENNLKNHIMHGTSNNDLPIKDNQELIINYKDLKDTLFNPEYNINEMEFNPLLKNSIHKDKKIDKVSNESRNVVSNSKINLNVIDGIEDNDYLGLDLNDDVISNFNVSDVSFHDDYNGDWSSTNDENIIFSDIICDSSTQTDLLQAQDNSSNTSPYNLQNILEKTSRHDTNEIPVLLLNQPCNSVICAHSLHKCKCKILHTSENSSNFKTFNYCNCSFCSKKCICINTTNINKYKKECNSENCENMTINKCKLDDNFTKKEANNKSTNTDLIVSQEYLFIDDNKIKNNRQCSEHIKDILANNKKTNNIGTNTDLLMVNDRNHNNNKLLKIEHKMAFIKDGIDLKEHNKKTILLFKKDLNLPGLESTTSLEPINTCDRITEKYFHRTNNNSNIDNKANLPKEDLIVETSKTSFNNKFIYSNKYSSNLKKDNIHLKDIKNTTELSKDTESIKCNKNSNNLIEKLNDFSIEYFLDSDSDVKQSENFITLEANTRNNFINDNSKLAVSYDLDSCLNDCELNLNADILSDGEDLKNDEVLINLRSKRNELCKLLLQLEKIPI